MKKVKMIMVLVSFLMLNAIQAQDKVLDDKKQDRREQLKNAKEQLSLSPDQEVKFVAISKKYATAMKTVKDSDIDKKEKLVKIREIQNNKNIEIKTILSEEQYVKYLALKEDIKLKIKEKRKD